MSVAPRIWPLVLGALLLLVSLAGPHALRTPTAPPAVPAPSLAPAHLTSGATAPTAGYTFYLQSAATVSQENGSSSFAYAALQENFTLAPGPSPYGMAFELNGLSDTGDWFQATVVYDWPGCPEGFAFGYELWDATGAPVGGGPTCTVPTLLASGDRVRLGLSLECTPGSVCFTFADDTTLWIGTVALAQPDPAATHFMNLDAAANAVGYFTGPMTELLDTVSTVCRIYMGLPRMDYRIWGDHLQLTRVVQWGDEFGVSATGTQTCAGFGFPFDLPSSPVTDFLDPGYPAFGSHPQGVQNWTAVSGERGVWRFETNIPSLNGALGSTAGDVGQGIPFYGAPQGGVAPYVCRWRFDGVPLPTSDCNVTRIFAAAGNHTVSVYGGDSLLNFASIGTTFWIDPELVVSTPVLDRTAVDAGESFSVSLTASGGKPPYYFTIIGLGGGCAGPTSPLVCQAWTLGTIRVSASVGDANAFTGFSPGSATLTVVPQPRAYLTPSPAPVGVGQVLELKAEGIDGIPPYTWTWSGLPPGCVAPANATDVTCVPTTLGSYNVTASLTDGYGGQASATAQVDVVPYTPPPPPPDTTQVVLLGAVILILGFVAVGAWAIVRIYRRPREPPRPPGPPR